MTGDEFLEAAGETMTPAIAAVIALAFDTVPQDEVGALIASFLGTMTRIALERVHEIIAQTESRPPSADTGAASRH